MKGRNKYQYRKIWEQYHGDIPLDELGRPYDIHHIDGNRENNNIDNLLAVSIQEHYDIHFKQEDWGACKALSMRLNDMPLNEKAELSRKIHTGRKRSEETKQKISKANKGRTQSLEERKKRSKPRPGSGPQGARSEETKQKMRKPKSEEHKKAMRGKPKPGAGPQGARSEETKQKMRKPRSEECKNKLKNLKSICPHCNKQGHPTPMRLWHFDKCKMKTK
jgi:hypothetical protein